MKGLVVPRVMDGHRHGVDMRLERIVGIAQRRQLERSVGLRRRRHRGLGESCALSDQHRHGGRRRSCHEFQALTSIHVWLP
jgi:hypothetical protein